MVCMMMLKLLLWFNDHLHWILCVLLLWYRRKCWRRVIGVVAMHPASECSSSIRQTSEHTKPSSSDDKLAVLCQFHRACGLCERNVPTSGLMATNVLLLVIFTHWKKFGSYWCLKNLNHLMNDHLTLLQNNCLWHFLRLLGEVLMFLVLSNFIVNFCHNRFLI